MYFESTLPSGCSIDGSVGSEEKIMFSSNKSQFLKQEVLVFQSVRQPFSPIQDATIFTFLYLTTDLPA